MFDTAPRVAAPSASPPTALRLSERTPDAALVAVLERPPEPDVGSFGRLERMGAYERVIARLQTLQAAEMAAFVQDAEYTMAAMLAAHDPARDGRLGVLDTVGDASNSAVAEIQMMLRLTTAATFDRVEQARRLHDPMLAPTADLARAGRLTWPKLRKILDGATGLEPAQVQWLQAVVLPKAPGQTTGQLAAAINRFLVGLTDADLPARRRDRKTRTRAVVVQPEPDGMATLRVFLPAAAATGIYAVTDEHARGCGAADPRTMDQRRADALVDLILRDTGTASDGSAVAAGRDAAAGAVGTGAAAVTPPDVPAVPGPGTVPGVAPAPPGGSPFVRNRVSVRINVTVSLDTLIGASDEPAELAGYGPIPASDARALAFDPDSVWYRLLTDPPTGRVVDRGTTAYRPPTALSELVRARHGTCGHPCCRTPAHRCDLDHVVPYDPSNGRGRTCAENLRPFCRPHHRLKHAPGWHVVLHADGSTEWTTPSGHVHVAEPSPVGPVRATHAATKRGPGVRALMRDPGLAARLAERTEEAPF